VKAQLIPSTTNYKEIYSSRKKLTSFNLYFKQTSDKLAASYGNETAKRLPYG
jgi:hypothetical protein